MKWRTLHYMGMLFVLLYASFAVAFSHGNLVGSPGWLNTCTSAYNGSPVNCPSGIAFRDWTQLTANFPGTQTTPMNTAAWNAGSQSTVFLPVINISGTLYGFTYASAGPEQAGQPYISTINLYTSTTGYLGWTGYGSNPLVSASSDTDIDASFSYMLQPRVIKIGSTYLMYLSAASTTYGNKSEVYLFTATSLTGPWTAYQTLPVVAHGSVTNNVPCIVQFGGQYIMYVSYGTTDTIYYYTSPNGYPPWTFVGQALQFNTGDWDTGDVDQDPFVIVNSHGFCEMTYTALGGNTQSIGYAISPDCITWYKYQTSFILQGSPGRWLGDTNWIESGGNIIFNRTDLFPGVTDTSGGYTEILTDH